MVRFLEKTMTPVLIVLIIVGLFIIAVINNSNSSINLSDFSQKTVTVCKGCTVYDLWKEYGGNSSWKEYSYEVQKLNDHSIGDIKIGEEINILMYESE